MNSMAKSLSETASIEFTVGLSKPKRSEVIFLLMGNEVPASAPEPRGLSFKRLIQSFILLRSRPIIST